MQKTVTCTNNRHICHLPVRCIILGAGNILGIRLRPCAPLKLDHHSCSRVEFLLKTDDRYFKDKGVTFSPWQPLRAPSAITHVLALGTLRSAGPDYCPLSREEET